MRGTAFSGGIIPRSTLVFTGTWLMLCGCGEQTTTVMDEPGIELAITVNRDVFTMNEPISATLTVKNTSDSTISVGKNTFIDWQFISFGAPNELSLIAPDGKNLAHVHQSEKKPGDFLVTLPPRSEKAIRIPLFKLFDFSQTGVYSLQLKLFDAKGVGYESNRVEFTLNEEENAEKADLRLGLEMKQTSYAPGQALLVSLEFINESKKDQRILLPQDDSFDGWVNPVYKFVIKDAQGRMIPMPARDGSMAEAHYLEANSRFIQAGKTTGLEIEFPYVRNELMPGVYSLKVIYIVRKQKIGKTGVLLDEKMDWPPSVQPGAIISNTVSFEVLPE